MKIIILAGKGESSSILFNAVNERFPVDKIIFEESVSKKKFFQRRVKKLGYLKVIGQLLFLVFIVPLIKLGKANRIQEILQKYQLNKTRINPNKIIEVGSINESIVVEQIKASNPDLILINGTRIISKKILKSTSAPFINIHAGITPKYRGVHGAYWALYNQDPELCGVSVHLVDPGIDTGGVLAQKIIKPTKEDNYSTYPFIQMGEGISLLKNKVIPNFMKSGKLNSIPSISKESFLWSHPTIFQYIKQRITSGIK
jgi:folate-dependent phosphoribosylglycinamide formyltransferase PurN